MTVEIWSDIVCPWCYIGKRRFEAALAQFPHRDEVEVVWRSFELDPTASRDSAGTLEDLLANKYGVSPAQARAMNERVTRLAADAGLNYRLDQARHGNTFDAHRLIHLAAAHGLQAEAKERLLRAYFTEGQPIGNFETLKSIAVELGLPKDEVEAAFSGEAYADEVRADEARAAALGISGVPFFVFEEKYGISGAQPAETFRETLEQVWAEQHPLTRLGEGDGDASCSDGSCAVDSTRSA